MNGGNKKKISIVLKSTLLGNRLQSEQSVKQVNEEKISINRIEKISKIQNSVSSNEDFQLTKSVKNTNFIKNDNQIGDNIKYEEESQSKSSPRFLPFAISRQQLTPSSSTTLISKRYFFLFKIFP
ncbi:unnamed protein product [Meloidogyne enterolobii]|uniref:Uncharacterized protein n=1 Tax=Meloidogyne enterolobii TaxID=390850 RepID=A0ACB0XPV3_MELEN